MPRNKNKSSPDALNRFIVDQADMISGKPAARRRLKSQETSAEQAPEPSEEETGPQRRSQDGDAPLDAFIAGAADVLSHPRTESGSRRGARRSPRNKKEAVPPLDQPIEDLIAGAADVLSMKPLSTATKRNRKPSP